MLFLKESEFNVRDKNVVFSKLSWNHLVCISALEILYHHMFKISNRSSCFPINVWNFRECKAGF